MRIIGGLALAATTPLLVLAAFPPIGWWPLILVALVPTLVAQHRIVPAKLAGLPWAVGLGGTVVITTRAALGNGGEILVKSLPILFAVALVFLGARDRRWQAATGYRWFVIAVPLGWVGLDAIFANNAL